MIPQPLIAVTDVEASSLWYQRVLGLTSGHGGVEYEQLLADGRMVMQLHDWNRHGHRFLGDEALKPYGNGVLLWFRTTEIDVAFERAEACGAEVLEALAVNADAKHREFWLRDPDGYVVVVAGPYGDVG